MNIALLGAGIAVVVVLGLFGLGYYSQQQSAADPQVTQQLRCGSAPNCVSSRAAASSPRYIAPFSGAEARSLMRALVRAIDEAGGTITLSTDAAVNAEFKSPLFGFVDDLVLRADHERRVVHVLSRSRVGYSDLGANRKRVERLRALLDN